MTPDQLTCHLWHKQPNLFTPVVANAWLTSQGAGGSGVARPSNINHWCSMTWHHDPLLIFFVLIHITILLCIRPLWGGGWRHYVLGLYVRVSVSTLISQECHNVRSSPSTVLTLYIMNFLKEQCNKSMGDVTMFAHNNTWGNKEDVSTKLNPAGWLSMPRLDTGL